ncbi:MAG: OmpA family protein [bacterium]|nr:OmpA family protein [bacterium]
MAVRRKSEGSEGESPFWISYSDLMTSLVILLILMVCAFLLQEQAKHRTIDEQEQIKRQIIAELMKDLQKAKYPVKVDARTGSITIADSVLFEVARSDIGAAGRAFLQRFIPVYSRILLGNPQNRQQIGSIMVMGFTDRVASYDYNMQLSVDRAVKVTQYIFQGVPTFPERENLRQVLSAVGRSFMDPRSTDKESRRVEFRFQFKDWATVDREQREAIDTGLNLTTGLPR